MLRKKTSTQVLVQAADLRDAVKKLDEGMKGTMADYQIGMVAETLCRRIPFEAKEGSNITEDKEVVRFIDKFPEGQCTETTVGGKPVIVDKTGGKTKVIPNNKSDTNGDD